MKVLRAAPSSQYFFPPAIGSSVSSTEERRPGAGVAHKVAPMNTLGMQLEQHLDDVAGVNVALTERLDSWVVGPRCVLACPATAAAAAAAAALSAPNNTSGYSPL